MLYEYNQFLEVDLVLNHLLKLTLPNVIRGLSAVSKWRE